MLSDADLDFLRELSVFAGLSESILASVRSYAERVELRPGEVLFREGEPAREMIVVRAGALEVVKRAERGGEACIARLGPGDVAGEMSLIDIQPRSAEVRAVGAASVVVLAAADLATIYRENKQAYTLLVLNIAREISLRLRRLDGVLANILVELQGATGAAAAAGEPAAPQSGNGSSNATEEPAGSR